MARVTTHVFVPVEQRRRLESGTNWDASDNYDDESKNLKTPNPIRPTRLGPYLNWLLLPFASTSPRN